MRFLLRLSSLVKYDTKQGQKCHLKVIFEVDRAHCAHQFNQKQYVVMSKRTSSYDLFLDDIAKGQRGQDTLYATLLNAVRRIGPGGRLPSTRDLAATIGVARGTIIAVFERLAAEGYVQMKRGHGTFVSDPLPDELLYVRSSAPDLRSVKDRGDSVLEHVSVRGLAFCQSKLSRGQTALLRKPFIPHQPALDMFPSKSWANVADKVLRNIDAEVMADADPMGYYPLRHAIAEYLRTVRAITCSPEQILITSGIQQSLDLIARVLLDPGSQVWVEDPGYPGTCEILTANGWS